MPKYIINTSKGAFEVEADRQPSKEEGEQLVAGMGETRQPEPQVPAAQPQAKPQEYTEVPVREQTMGEMARGIAMEVGGTLASTAAGAAVLGPVGAVAGAVGGGSFFNWLRQKMEQEEGTRADISKGEIAASGVMGFIPASFGLKAIRSSTGFVKPAVIRATQGGATAMTAESVKGMIDKGELPEWQELAVAGGVGAATGGVLGAVEKRYQMAGNLIASPAIAQAAQVGTGIGVGAYVYNDAVEKGDPNALPKAFLYGVATYGATHAPSVLFNTKGIEDKFSSAIVGPEAKLGKEAIGGIETYMNGLKANQTEAYNIGISVKKEIGKSSNPSQLTADVTSVLDGNASTNILPPSIRPYIERFNVLRAENSDIIAQMPIPQAQKDAILNNKTSYIRRAYAAHDPRAKREVDFDTPATRQAYKGELVSEFMANSGVTQAEAERMADRQMTRMLDDIGYLWSANFAGGPTNGPTSPLMRRHELSDKARAWLGEVVEPGARIANTLNTQARLVLHESHDEFMKNFLINSGIGSYTKRAGDVLLVAAESPTLHSKLKDIYVPEVWNNAYKEMLSPNLFGDGTMAKSWMSLQGFSKAMKTVGNLPEAVMPQVLGNMAIAAASFKINPADLAGAAREVGRIYGFGTKGMNAQAKVDMFKRFKKLESLGIVQSGAEAQELSTLIEQSSFAKKPKEVLDKFSRAYGFPDSFVRLAIFEQNVREIQSYSPNLGMDEIMKRAANLTNDTFPTYSRIARRFRQLTAIGAANAFGSFEYEVVRTSVNNVKHISYLMQEGYRLGTSQNALDRQMGQKMIAVAAKRSLALASVAGMTTGLATWGSRVLGSSDQDVKDTDKIAPTFDTDKAKIVKVNRDGTYSYAPINYMMPYANMATTLAKALNGENPLPYLKTTFLGDDLGPLLTSTTEAITNTYYGTKVSITEPRDNQLLAERLISRAFLPQFITGTLSRVEKAARGETNKLGTKYTFEDQLLRFGGYRSNTMDILGSAAVRIRDIAQPLGEELSGYKRIIKNKIDPVTGQYVGINEDAIYRERASRYLAGQEQLAETYRAIKRLAAKTDTITDDKIINAFRAAGVPNRLIAGAIFGYKVPMPRGMDESDTQVVEAIMADPEKRKDYNNQLKAKAGNDPIHYGRLMKAYGEYKKNEAMKVDGLTKLFGGLGVEDGERAKNIRWSMNQLPDENDRKAFLNKLLRTGVATGEVMRQIYDLERQAKRQQGQ